MRNYKILSVQVVKGDSLNKKWKSHMQVIETDKGKFIDNMPGKQFGFFSIAKPGFDWSILKGKEISESEVKIFEHSGYNWLNKQGDN